MRDWTAAAAQHPEAFLWIDGRPVPIIAGGSSDPPKVPGPPPPTPQEIEIQTQQIALMKTQAEQAERNLAMQKELGPGYTDLLKQQVALATEEAQRARDRAPAEQALAVRQLAAAEQQLKMAEKGMKLQDQLQPFVLQSMRLVEDPGGTVRRMTETEYVGTLGDQEKLAYQNTSLALEREAKALKGELPLTDAGQQRKRDEFTAFKEQMARGGNPITGDVPGSAAATTTAGNQALKAFNERWGVVEEAERRGELTMGSQSVLQRMGVASDIGARERAGMLSAVPQYSMPGYRGTGGGGSGVGGMGFPSAGGPDFGSALQPFQAQRAGMMQSNLANAQLQSQSNQQNRMRDMQMGAASGALLGGAIGSIFPVVGTAVGAGVGGLVGGGVGYTASSRDVKKDIRRASRRQEDHALKMVKDMKTYTYRYKAESAQTPKRLGMMADEVPAAIATPDRRGLDVGRTLGLLTAATRALARQKGR